MKFKVCEYCRSYLDFGERCNCQKELEIKRKELESLLNQDSDGQISIIKAQNSMIK